MVILDDMILDIGKFMDDHPGGKFSMEHNIGKDVSKFFFGGYSLENIDQVEHHLHSASAKKIANKLAIGHLTEQAPERMMVINQIDRSASISGSTKTFMFKNSTMSSEDDNTFLRLLSTKCSLLDTSQIGRHYLVQPAVASQGSSNISIKKRHYTEAFSMR